MRSIDVDLLRAFVAVAETGRMTKAARVVSLSQGAVSQQIKRLERFFDVRLLDRRADAARPTREGEKLMVLAHRIIALNDEAISQMRAADFTGEVRLGVPHDIVGTFMPPILRAFGQAHPGVRVTLVSDTTTVLRAHLRDREVDLILTTEARHGGSAQLLQDPLVWVGAQGGEAHRRRPLSVALGREGCGFRRSATDALTRARIAWRPICQVGSLEPVFASLEADMAIAPFLARTVPERLAIVEDPALPELPLFHINLRLPSTGVGAVASELARSIREGFARRYA